MDAICPALCDHSVEQGLASVASALPVQWNILPPYLHSITDTTAFKHKLKTKRFGQAFYH